MYVIFPASDVVAESYYALVAQESDINPAADLVALPTPPPIYHDTSVEQEIANHKILVRKDELIPNPAGEALKAERERKKKKREEPKPYKYTGKLHVNVRMAASSGTAVANAASAPGGTTPQLSLGVASVSISPGNAERLLIRDLIHPNLIEPLKNQQSSTFRLVKTGKKNLDFGVLLNSALSVLHALHYLIIEFIWPPIRYPRKLKVFQFGIFRIFGHPFGHTF